MMIRATRTRRPSRLALVAGGVMVMGSSWTLAGRAGAVDVVGGRVQFAPSQRVIDTREGTGGTLGPVTELPVSGGLLNVTITQPAGPGRAPRR